MTSLGFNKDINMLLHDSHYIAGRGTLKHQSSTFSSGDQIMIEKNYKLVTKLMIISSNVGNYQRIMFIGDYQWI